MKAEQPLWGRGIMISPQHFQQQIAYTAWSTECIAQMGAALGTVGAFIARMQTLTPPHSFTSIHNRAIDK